MGLANKKNNILQDLNLLYKKLYESGLIEGYDKGYDDGFEDGMKKAKDQYKASISDGLRHGSGECGKIMVKWKSKS
ncbi:hypothetical protein FDJ70_01830 [Clostridium botulinum]|uniref:Uncharacterized protein n=1 Tax=Clostridium botulinum D str. 1873 TaxID=592027 RepID=A0A9P2G7Y3_CLOBO|nr:MULTISPECIES: hypothetical protein [Clostridium]EES91574.1 conserved hypothetical protein [Clostridium botulinum D str. 1873]MBO3442298.1 hypothetical protein [Clostridium haemolyticum]NFV46428.1 hypothetical protein [Clostridium botulinum]QPW56738.1 hypothetical protein IRP61_12375 [Clostridium botulinum]